MQRVLDESIGALSGPVPNSSPENGKRGGNYPLCIYQVEYLGISNLLGRPPLKAIAPVLNSKVLSRGVPVCH